MSFLERADAVIDSVLLQIENEFESDDSESELNDGEFRPIIHQVRNTGNNKTLIELNFLLQLSGFILHRSSAADLEVVTVHLEQLQMKIDSRLTTLGDFMEDD